MITTTTTGNRKKYRLYGTFYEYVYTEVEAESIEEANDMASAFERDDWDCDDGGFELSGSQTEVVNKKYKVYIKVDHIINEVEADSKEEAEEKAMCFDWDEHIHAVSVDAEESSE